MPKVDIPLLLIVLLLLLSLSAYLVGWIVYPFGSIVLGALLLFRLSALYNKP